MEISQSLQKEALERSIIAGITFILLGIGILFLGLITESLEENIYRIAFAICLVNVGRVSLQFYYKKKFPLSKLFLFWRGVAIANAILWSTYFFLGSLNYELGSIQFSIITFMLLGITAGSLTSLVADPFVHKIFLILSYLGPCLAFLYKLIFLGASSGQAAIFILGFGFIYFYFQANKIYSMMVKNLQQQEELVKEKNKLANALDQLEKTQNDLIRSQLENLEKKRLSFIGMFASGLAHEINNPLTIAIGLTTKIRKEIEKNQATEILKNVEPVFEKLTSNFIRISSIIKSLREFSSEKMDSEDIKIFEIAELFETLEVFFKGTFTEENILLEIASIPKVRVQANFNLLSRAFFNLIQNSYESIKGLDKKFIKINFFINNKTLSVFIIDSGNGIAKDIQNKIFDPFFTTKDVGQGTGLGLSSAIGIIKSQNGELLYVNDQVNTTFEIRLPIL